MGNRILKDSKEVADLAEKFLDALMWRDLTTEEKRRLRL